MMEGLHHQQRQLAALLSAALPRDVSTSSPGAVESSRLAAIESLHAAIVYPSNAVLVAHSAPFLCQGLAQLLSDKSHALRQLAVKAYGALCSKVCSTPVSSNGRQSHFIVTGLVDHFIEWAVPLLNNSNIGNEATELALEGIHEFLNVGDTSGVDRYVPSILKASQELLEDERTSWAILHRILTIITLITLKFPDCFHHHFVDIVDLLLGWALVPDLSDLDRSVIMDSFLHFQKHWVSNLSFSIGLLSKFVVDMELLLQEGSPGMPQKFQRFMALLACFSRILQSTASGLLEINLIGQLNEPLEKRVPQFLGCLSVLGKKFGWSKWLDDCWRCLILLAEILGEKFCTYYPFAVDVLFESLEMTCTAQPPKSDKLSNLEICGILKTNYQLLSLQGLGLLASSVQKVLQFDTPVSKLRLHPNHSVTACCGATYVFLLQHANNEVVKQGISSLFEEIKDLKNIFTNITFQPHVNRAMDSKTYSKFEVLALIRFDLKVLCCCIPLEGDRIFTTQPETSRLYLERSEKLATLIIDQLYSFDAPFQGHVELQVDIIKIMKRLSAIEFFSRSVIRKQLNVKDSEGIRSNEITCKSMALYGSACMLNVHLSKYWTVLENSIHIRSPVAVKLEALEWIHEFCADTIQLQESLKETMNLSEKNVHAGFLGILLSSLIDMASYQEPKVRFRVASIFEVIVQKFIPAIFFYLLSRVCLERLGDPDADIRNAFTKLLSQILPIAIHAHGLVDCETSTILTYGDCLVKRSSWHWKHVFALKQLPQKLRPQQLVTILSYISQRWTAPLSSWIQRFVHNSHPTGLSLSSHEEREDTFANGLLLRVKIEHDFLKNVCAVNNLAALWWAIHEAVRYCIVHRLRTNLGGPTQTFTELERLLMDVPRCVHVDVEQSDSNTDVIGSSHPHLLRMRLLLEFVESLKKNVYNSYDGSIVLPNATRQSVLFFRANQKVCEEWFSRMSEPMMNAALAVQCYDATIQYCSLRLQDLKFQAGFVCKDKIHGQFIGEDQNNKVKFREDIFKVIRLLALTLCKNHEPKSLIGLQKWASESFSCLLIDDNHKICHSGVLGPFFWITGLVYMAEGQYENAAAYFTFSLQNEDALNLMGSDGVQFAIARTIESFSAVSDWKSLEKWLLELHALRSKHAGKDYSAALTTAGNDLNALQAFAHFDEGDPQAAWSCLNLTPKSSNNLTLDPKVALQRSEQMLLQAILFQSEGKTENVLAEIRKARLMLEEILCVLPLDGLMDTTAFATQLHCIFAFEDGCNLVNDKDRQKQHFSTLSSSYVQLGHSPMNMLYQDCNQWLKILRVYQAILPGTVSTIKLCQDLMSLSRNQKNFGLARHLNNIIKNFLSNCCSMELHDYGTFHLQYESILLMHAEDKIEIAFQELLELVHPHILSSNNMTSDVGLGCLKAKACLKLSKWLREDYVRLMNSGENVPKLIKYFKSANKFSDGANKLIIGENSTPQMYLGIVDEIVGFAMMSATHLCPTMGKAWIYYAHWCHDQAKKSLRSLHVNDLSRSSHSSTISQGSASDRLTEEEISRIELSILQLFEKRREIAGLDYEGEELTGCLGFEKWSQKHVDDIVWKIVSMIQTTTGFFGAQDGEFISSATTSKLQILVTPLVTDLEEGDIESFLGILLDIWWSLRRRRVSLFGHAACGFMQYLSYSCVSSVQLRGFDCEKSGSYVLRAVLYILDILLNYGVELEDTLQSPLSRTPLMPWQEVTPQLFARVSSHPEEVVRKQLEGLLIMLAKASPWAVVYPTLVDISSYNNVPPKELENILVCLRKLYPRLIQDVQLMIEELGNVTVLWEELWLSTFQDLHADVVRRIKVLKEEAVRTENNSTLSHAEKIKINSAKYSAIMAPIVVSLERRLSTTSKEPETPYEVWFAQEHMEKIRFAVSRFKMAPVSTALLEDVWRPFEVIVASLASSPGKSSVLLSEVAPKLLLLSSSDIPMPGFEKQAVLSGVGVTANTSFQGTVKIASFSEQVVVLPTKTKPKKLVIVGSDGEKYTYLLKGREDLRLDARIMQLLQAINRLLYSSIATRNRCLSIRCYSVTPISGRSGLIQWVDNITSLYTVFKSWQQRTQLARMPTSKDGDAKSCVAVPRPSDMFYGKIIPALKEKGIKKVISRRDWPHEVKRNVLVDLMKEVPRQLLYQELWCASEGFNGFSSKQKRFSGSIAVMSTVGYIMGLGDRHLDNILVDFSSGDIVHIDYNVCFDKGQKLKVPEVVPFRLTQTIEAALGFTGVEGVMRSDCEGVLGVLKKNKDVVLMLLEVFVWDPLVEWTHEDFHDDSTVGGEERRGMELAVCLSLFASRVQEIRGPFQEHRDLLLAALHALDTALTRFTDVLNRYEVVSALFYHVDKERSSLLMNESSAKSIVTEFTSKIDKTRILHGIQGQEFDEARTAVSKMAADAVILLDEHRRNLDSLRSGSVIESMSNEKLSVGDEEVSLIAAEVLADVPLIGIPEPTLTACRDMDKEVSHFIDEMVQGHSTAVTALEEYSLALRRILPVNYHTTSQLNDWVQVLQLSANNISSDILSVMRKRGSEILAGVHGDELESKMRIHDDLCLEVGNCSDRMEQVRKECSDLLNSIGIDAECKAKDHLMSAFTDLTQSSDCTREENMSSPAQLMKWKSGGNVELQDKQRMEMILVLLNVAASSTFSTVKYNIVDLMNKLVTDLPCDFEMRLASLEEQVEKVILISGFVEEVQSYFGNSEVRTGGYSTVLYYLHNRNLVSIIKDGLLACRILGNELIEDVLPDIVEHIVSYNSEVLNAFGLLSEIRASVDAALERFNSMASDRDSLVELEMNYFVDVSLITERQLVLKEAAAKGHDDLSWEEAEELASREEACRIQLDQLHLSWNRKDLQLSYLIKREDAVRNDIVSCEHRLEILTNGMTDDDSHTMKSKMLLCSLFKPFSRLESNDKELTAVRGTIPLFDNKVFIHKDERKPGYPFSQRVWKFFSMHSFFLWKICFIDTFLDSCRSEISTLIHQNAEFDQLLNAVKRKVESLLHEYLIQYLVGQITPALVAWLDKEAKMVRQFPVDVVEENHEAVERLREMLEEYCNAHETVRAARRAASTMEKQIFDLSETIKKTSLEVVQLEWMHDICFIPFRSNLFIPPEFRCGPDDFCSDLLNFSRPKFLERLQFATSKLERSLDGLQACLQSSRAVECQLETAMPWVCCDSTHGVVTDASGNHLGVHQEFHVHLVKRQNFLSDYCKKASEIMKICKSVLQFEALRDGIIHVTSDASGSDWQQIYMNALTRLDIAYHSFSVIEQEMGIAQSGIEAASTGLSSAEYELCEASVRAKSVAGNLEGTVIALKESAYLTSAAVSAFGHAINDHATLTSEFGSTLEEILTISESVHDLHNLGKEAVSVHSSMMKDISKASSIVLPLEAMLSKIVAVMAKGEISEISAVRGQALDKSLSLRIREAHIAFKPLVSAIDSGLNDLHCMLIELARAASLHAGNLHKALEGIGGSEEAKSDQVIVFPADLGIHEVRSDNSETDEVLSSSCSHASPVELSYMERGWLSPPDTISSSSADLGLSQGSRKSSCSSGGTATQESDYENELKPCISIEVGRSDDNFSISSLAPSNEVHPTTEKADTISKFASMNRAEAEGIITPTTSDVEAPPSAVRGRNAYAVSALQRVESKLDGSHIAENRNLSISEQVDFLLKQATSIDNLCNMYEGWTPWI